MADPIHPKKKEEIIQTNITVREVNLLRVLRKLEYGKVLVHKADGLIIRCELTDSVLIDDKRGSELGLSL